MVRTTRKPGIAGHRYGHVPSGLGPLGPPSAMPYHTMLCNSARSAAMNTPYSFIRSSPTLPTQSAWCLLHERQGKRLRECTSTQDGVFHRQDGAALRAGQLLAYLVIVCLGAHVLAVPARGRLRNGQCPIRSHNVPVLTTSPILYAICTRNRPPYNNKQRGRRYRRSSEAPFARRIFCSSCSAISRHLIA